MEIKILEYSRVRAGIVRVQSHNYRKGKWKVNPNYALHEMLINKPTMMFPVVHSKVIKKIVEENDTAKNRTRDKV